ncbi:MAG: hypothetical protein K2J15_00110 [Muribaculaceae bacterium]|nr:hypothetical protein [Muribaculaceae bacterium]
MDGLVWQYIIVLIIVLAAIVRIIMGLRKAHKNNSAGGCCGCSLADSCRDARTNRNKKTLTKGTAIDNRDCCKPHDITSANKK